MRPIRKTDRTRASQLSTERTVKNAFYYENPHCLFLFSPLPLPEQWEEPRGRSFHSALTGVILKKMVREGQDARMYKQGGVGTNQPSCILCPFFFLLLCSNKGKLKPINSGTRIPLMDPDCSNISLQYFIWQNIDIIIDHFKSVLKSHFSSVAHWLR